jgi:hypothetical protein
VIRELAEVSGSIAFGGKGYIAFSVGAGKVVWTMGGVSRRGKLLKVVETYSANELFRGILFLTTLSFNVCDGVMKVTLVMKVCRFCKQISSMRLLCLCSDALFKY